MSETQVLDFSRKYRPQTLDEVCGQSTVVATIKKWIEAVPYVEESIREFGFLVPLVIDNDNVIVTGHTRHQAALRLNYTEVPCIRATNLTAKQIEAFRIADNKVSEYSQWHTTFLEEILGELGDTFDMGKFGFLDTDALAESLADSLQAGEETLETAAFNPLEVKAFEHWDYLVFVFEDEMSWIKACELFNIKKVDMVYGNNKLRGMGRVVLGKRLFEGLEKLKKFDGVFLPESEFSKSEAGTESEPVKNEPPKLNLS